ncbi:MAG: Methylated-DNA-[protein]-cysteine S-methyltransferase [uncultured Thermomicrobiales bacterium]|uniref:Methylated-DNA-[protein]-cysteine S-methyltransferase n=1 Tax=uncultured Thermomicrobiales bacterium TaxID=1645740 RepID=A0A6J4UCI0_9BACT|nr:MAG: Methylated-DNA-[protein]-cysteine S-methyltransferase [uncultured Thermomicrobiales bacterium]
MPASADFSARVYAVVARIPRGRVTTYGRIARTIGDPRGARMVGWALMGAVGAVDLPAHRVVNRNGELTGGWYFGHPDIMRARLLEEGIPFSDDYTVDLRQCVWDPWEDGDEPPVLDVVSPLGPDG